MQRVRLSSVAAARPWVWLVGGCLLLSLGAFWTINAGAQAQNCADCTWLPLQTADTLAGTMAAGMDSPFLTYSPGWTVTPDGADPPEPPDPFATPAGSVSFSYTGGDLYLLLAPGDYWAYMYVTVDGQPANRLPTIAGNANSRGEAAGYIPLLAPERPRGEEGGLTPRWQLVHHTDDETAKNVLLEIWRGWGQTPLRGIAVDLPPGTRVEPQGPSLAQVAAVRWPPVLLTVLGVWALGTGGWIGVRNRQAQHSAPPGRTHQVGRVQPETAALTLAGAGLLLVVSSVVLDFWLLCALGLISLALAGVVRPAFWIGALLFGLPFAYGIKLPVLPLRDFDLIDIGVWGGAAIVLLHRAGQVWGMAPGRPHPWDGTAHSMRRQAPVLLALAGVVSWALVSAAGANYRDLALREWRVVFLTAAVFAAVLAAALRWSPRPSADRRLLVTAWLGGGTLIALVGLSGYVVGNEWVSQAEGVRRVQAFYGSANNLALYLDRTLAVSLALVLFTRPARVQVLWALLAAPQALAWLLTFSKGSLLLAAPAMALVLLAGGAWLLGQEERSRRPLWILLGIGVAGMLLLAPFLGTERFQRLFDFGQGTGFLRVQLWRSALQMGLDHLLVGVGPDNFLYAYRSGYMLPQAWQEPHLNHPHNLLLDWWTRLGLPGLLLGLTWLGAGTWAVLRWLRAGPDRALALGVLAAIAAGLAHGLIDVSYALPDLMLVWVLLFGLAALVTSPAEPTGAPPAGRHASGPRVRTQPLAQRLPTK